MTTAFNWKADTASQDHFGALKKLLSSANPLATRRVVEPRIFDQRPPVTTSTKEMTPQPSRFYRASAEMA